MQNKNTKIKGTIQEHVPPSKGSVIFSLFKLFCLCFFSPLTKSRELPWLSFLKVNSDLKWGCWRSKVGFSFKGHPRWLLDVIAFTTLHFVPSSLLNSSTFCNIIMQFGSYCRNKETTTKQKEKKRRTQMPENMFKLSNLAAWQDDYVVVWLISSWSLSRLNTWKAKLLQHTQRDYSPEQPLQESKIKVHGISIL